MIKVKNLEKNFGDFTAVNKISFEIGAGEIFGLLGPNGAGKTTTLRMIAGLITPSDGTVEVCGYKLDQLLEIKKNIGFLTGSTALYGRLTPIEILEYFGTLNYMPVKLIKKRINYLITLFQMEEFQRAGILPVIHDPYSRKQQSNMHLNQEQESPAPGCRREDC